VDSEDRFTLLMMAIVAAVCIVGIVAAAAIEIAKATAGSQ